MTDKQIIIDGVDVTECRHFNYGEGYNQETEEFVDGACECITAHDSYGEFMYYGICKDRNCYYKQLKRKEQEIEELKKCYKNNLALLNLEETNTTKLVNKAMKLEQTLAEIKKLAEKEFCRHPECCEFCAISNDCLNQKIIEKINEVENGNI